MRNELETKMGGMGPWCHFIRKRNGNDIGKHGPWCNVPRIGMRNIMETEMGNPGTGAISHEKKWK